MLGITIEAYLTDKCYWMRLDRYMKTMPITWENNLKPCCSSIAGMLMPKKFCNPNGSDVRIISHLGLGLNESQTFKAQGSGIMYGPNAVEDRR